jgi:hypothetical protein
VVRKSTVNSDESAPASSSDSKEYRKQRRVGTGLGQVIRKSTVNSDKSVLASKSCLSPIEANAEVTDDNTATDGLTKKIDFSHVSISQLKLEKRPRGLGADMGTEMKNFEASTLD